jgi:hypothetical protein
MKPLVLTNFMIPDLLPDHADLAVFPYFRFVWGPLPSSGELAAYLGPRTVDGPARGYHWSDWASRWGDSEHKRHKKLGLAEFCQRYETVELWYDTGPEAQLELCWLLDYFRLKPEAAARLKMCLIDRDLIELSSMDAFSREWPPLVDVTEREITTGSTAWQAYRAATPEACFALLKTDLSALALLRPVLLDLLQELPSAVTGLGATEMRMLELVGRGYSRTNALVHIESLRQTRVFNEFEYGYLLQGLAHGPTPAVAGLDDRLRTIPRESFDGRMDRSNLSLTDFGRAVLAGKEDFSHHNPIDRWWGGTHLTNDNLWRYDPVLTAPAKRSSR